jgi:hypothetical protein
MGEYTKIAAARKVADKPLDEDLVEDLSDHGDYNFDHAVRGGTDAVGVRLAIARGETDFTAVSQTLVQVDITFATDSDDGDPGFSAAPRVIVTLKEDATSTNDWTGLAAGDEMWVYIEEGYPSTTVCRCQVWFDDGGAGTNYKGHLQFIAIGEPTAGE